jgi:type I restriction enzyme S subunit
LAELGEIVDVNPPADARDDSLSCSFVPMAAVEEETGRLDPSARRTVGELRGRSYRPFREGDVLVAKITPSMENGKAAVASHLFGGIGFGSTEFHVLRPVAGVDAKYVLHFVLQRSFRAWARRNMTGTAGQLRVPARFLASVAIPVPPLAEQRRIVVAIEEQFSRLDASVDLLALAASRLSQVPGRGVARREDRRLLRPR